MNRQKSKVLVTSATALLQAAEVLRKKKKKGEDWPYSSLWRRVHANADAQRVLSPWPVPMPRQWKALVNRPQTESEVEAIRRCVRKGCPFGSERWINQSAARLQLGHTLRSPGRPPKT